MLLFLLSPALTATLTVGPAGEYSEVSAAIAASSPGDTIEIASGTYTDDTANLPHGDLHFIGVGDTRPVLLVTEDIPNRKGIFAIPVDAGPVTVEGLHFEGARISDDDGANGAGIRMQGSALTVRDCVFHDNQMGILAGGTDGFTVYVEHSEFDDNGRDGSGYEHNIYIGTDECSEFTFIGNYSHNASSGHQVKSRCQVNRILYNRLMDEGEGNSSYIIDLPEGGHSVVVGNLMQQGPNAENSSAILSYAAESTNDVMVLYAAHNTIVNDKATSATAFIRMNQGEAVVLRNNLFIGPGTSLQLDDNATLADDLGSLHLETGEVLVDREGYDYGLVAGSAPQDAGVEAGTVDGEALRPTLQYVHPMATETRFDDDAPDIGAYGLGEPPAGDTGSSDTGSGGTGSGGTDTGPEPDNDNPGKDDGCGCTSASTAASSAWVFLLLGGVLGFRRSGLVATSRPAKAQ